MSPRSRPARDSGQIPAGAHRTRPTVVRGNKGCIGNGALRSEGLGAAVASNAVIGALAEAGSKAAHKLPAAYC